MRILSAIALVSALAAPAAAEFITLRVPPSVGVDAAGMTLRQALNAYERAESEGLPQAWTLVVARKGELLDLGGDNRLLLTQTTSASAEILHLKGAESSTLVLPVGATTSSGDLTLVLAAVGRSDARLTARARDLSPAFSDVRPDGGSRVRVENPSGPTLRIESPESRDLRFSERFLREWFAGVPKDDALRSAWTAHPPQRTARTVATATPSYVDPTNMFSPEDDGLGDVTVSLSAVMADASAIGVLNSSISYRSDGARGDGAVGGRMDGDGVDVRYGRPGDRFRATLSALEREGRVRSLSEATVRVPLGGEGSFNFDGANGPTDGYVSARGQGKRIILDFSFGAGAGQSNSRVAVQDGQTVLVTRYRSSRTETSSSGPPLVTGIPYVGPLIGNSSKASRETEWALYATVTR